MVERVSSLLVYPPANAFDFSLKGVQGSNTGGVGWLGDPPRGTMSSTMCSTMRGVHSTLRTGQYEYEVLDGVPLRTTARIGSAGHGAIGRPRGLGRYGKESNGGRYGSISRRKKNAKKG